MLKTLLTFCVLLLALSSYGQCDFNITSNATICSGYPVTLSTNYTGSGNLQWQTSNGNGSFSSTTGDSTTYYSSISDTGQIAITAVVDDSGNVCNNHTEVFYLNVNYAYVNAGPDQTVCTSVNFLNLDGFAFGPITWTTTGTGTFSNPTSPTTTYSPTQQDKVNGAVAFYASSTYNGCYKQDTVLAFFNDLPTVNAGPDQIICSSQNYKSIYGTTTGAGSRTWTTSGTGTFLYQGQDSTRYAPSAVDIATGTVVLALTATGCNSVVDNMTLVITPSPQITVGADQFMAAENYLNATIAVATGVQWVSTGSGTFLPNATSLSVTYIPSAADQQGPSNVYIYGSTTGNGTCDIASDYLQLFRDTACYLNAGPDQVVCVNDTISLNATVNQGSVNWTSTGAGTIVDENSVNAYYIPSGADANTTVYFIANGINNGSCVSTDTLAVTFTNGTATANAFSDETACTTTSGVIIVGVTNTTTKYWTTSGTGYFADPYQDSTTYYPSASDKMAGAVTLTITAIGCGNVSDSKSLSFIPGPVVEAGPNQTLSTTNSLVATITNAGSVLWSTSGSGTFSSQTSLSTVYSPSQSDIDSGFVVISIATVGNGACPAAYDQLVLTGNAVACNISITKTQSGNTVNVVANNTDGQSVGSYFWDFGDGSYAYGKVQSHTYADTGTYYVVAYYSTPNGLCDDTAGVIVHINAVVTSTFNISGTVYASINRIDYAYVTLFELEGAVYKYMQTVELDPADNGNYTFTNVPNGQYIIYAIPTFESSYINFIPCYFPNVTLWAGATEIIVNNSNQSGKNIYMIPFTPPADGWNLGSAIIAGVITFDANSALRVADASANPSQYAVVSLYNSSNELLATTNTDEFGNYSFEGIAAGNYTLKVEYPGGKAGETSFPVTTTAGNTTQVNTEITREEIVNGVVSETLTTVVSAYPNPVQGDLTIVINNSDNAEVTLYNSLGNMVETIHMNGDHASVNMSMLPSGIYSYVVTQGDQKFVGKVVKQ